MKVTLVHHPGAGGTAPSRDELLAMLAAHGHEASYATSDGDLADRIHGDHDLVAIAGGDGTVARVLAACRPDAPPVTILPLGTANNIAAAFGITAPLVDLVAGLNRGHLRLMQPGRVTAGTDGAPQPDSSSPAPSGTPSFPLPFFESVGIGAIATALGPVNAQRMPSQAKIPEGLGALIRQIGRAAPVAVTLEADGERVALEALFIEVMVIDRFGPRLVLVATSPPPGRLAIATLVEQDRQAFLDWLATEPTRRGPAPVGIRLATSASLRWQAGDWHHDDRFHRSAATSITIRRHGELRLLVPRTSR